MKPTLHVVKPEPTVDLARIVRIPTIEVMESDLDTLDALVAAENTAFGFFTGTASAAVSVGLSWVASTGLSPTRQAIFAATVLILAVFAAWFCAQWLLARRRRPALLRELRARAPRP